MFSKEEGSINIDTLDIFVKPNILKILNSYREALQWTKEENKRKYFTLFNSDSKFRLLDTLKSIVEESKSKQSLNFKNEICFYILEETEGEVIKPASFLRLEFNAQVVPEKKISFGSELQFFVFNSEIQYYESLIENFDLSFDFLIKQRNLLFMDLKTNSLMANMKPSIIANLFDTLSLFSSN